MAETEIHGFKVRFDDTSHTLNNAVRHLSERLEKDEAKVFFDDARRDRINHTAHLEIRNHERNRHDNITLVHNTSDDSYELRKRRHHLF